MRRRPSSSAKFLLAGLLACASAHWAGAQSTIGEEGGIQFLLPIGARSVGMGQAVAAMATGTDALWWTPALVARGPREVAFHFTKILTLESDAAGAVVIPVQRVGAFALSVRYLNEGEQEATDRVTGEVTGKFSTITAVVGATFATTFSSRFAAGLTYKLVRLDFPCTGVCDRPPHTPQTIALDLGAQYIVTRDSLITFGVAFRNAGPKLQVNDSPQADPLPVRADVGVAYAPTFAQLPKEARVRLAADLVARTSGGYAPGYRLGAELSWMERYQARGGYVVEGPIGSGATFGLGLSSGKLQIDLARMLVSSGAEGASPSYLSLRYLF
jgi:hypothetical protein